MSSIAILVVSAIGAPYMSRPPERSRIEAKMILSLPCARPIIGAEDIANAEDPARKLLRENVILFTPCWGLN
jgi:hypothetical protein